MAFIHLLKLETGWNTAMIYAFENQYIVALKMHKSTRSIQATPSLYTAEHAATAPWDGRCRKVVYSDNQKGRMK